VQEGPGAIQPGGVAPGVNQRLESPPDTGGVVPGENGLALNDADPVWFAVMSSIRITRGVQGTFGFQEYGELGEEAEAAREPAGMKEKVESAKIASVRVKAAALTPTCLRLVSSMVSLVPPVAA
jgi:hypothetical protein